MIIKEFQRLKSIELEEQKESLDWQIKRTLSKVNYRIHADAIKNHLIPQKLQQTKLEGLYYASEADFIEPRFVRSDRQRMARRKPHAQRQYAGLRHRRTTFGTRQSRKLKCRIYQNGLGQTRPFYKTQRCGDLSDGTLDGRADFIEINVGGKYG